MRPAAAMLAVIAAASSPAHADPAACKAKGGTWHADDDELAGCMIKGKRDGVWEARLPSGQLRERITYDKGVKHGPSVAFHPATCKIAERGAWVAGEKDGPWASWLETGQRDSEGTYKADLREGVWRIYTDGVKVIEGPFVADAADGTMTEWFTTAVQWRTSEMKAGFSPGPDETACRADGGAWLVDYRAREEGCAKLGERAGVWRGYASDGKLAWRSTYVADKEQGEHVDYHPTGEILRRGQMVAGVPDGVHRFVAKDGKVLGVSTITSGAGAWTAYFPDGVVAETGTYAGGQRDGLWRRYHAKGHLLDETTWAKGVLEGPHRDFFLSGELAAEGAFAGGYRDGVWVAYWSNGKIAWAGAYDQGNRTGTWFNGGYSGIAESFGAMADDMRTGTWTLFHADGSRAAIGAYSGGGKQGPWLEWWPSGELWRTVSYVDDVEDSPQAQACDELGGAWVSDPQQRTLGCQVCRALDEDDEGPVEKEKLGVWTWWHPNGVVEKQGRMEQGKREGVWKFWFDSGQLMLEGELHEDLEEGAWIGHYRDGRSRFTGGYRRGAPDGAWTSYHPDGSPAATGSYVAGQKVGRWIYHHPGGVKKEEGEYRDGAPVGAWTSYYPDGKPAASGTYIAGLRDGAWTFWRPDGSPWRTVQFTAGKEASAK